MYKLGQEKNSGQYKLKWWRIHVQQEPQKSEKNRKIMIFPTFQQKSPEILHAG